ncbi:MAG: recombinase family protein [Acidithiobacillus ferrooxidans]
MQFKRLTGAIDTGTPSGRFFFHVMVRLAEMERDLTIERSCAGLEVARKFGWMPGTKRLMTESKVALARKPPDNDTPRREVAEHIVASLLTLYRWIPGASHS